MSNPNLLPMLLINSVLTFSLGFVATPQKSYAGEANASATADFELMFDINGKFKAVSDIFNVSAIGASFIPDIDGTAMPMSFIADCDGMINEVVKIENPNGFAIGTSEPSSSCNGELLLRNTTIAKSLPVNPRLKTFSEVTGTARFQGTITPTENINLSIKGDFYFEQDLSIKEWNPPETKIAKTDLSGLIILRNVTNNETVRRLPFFHPSIVLENENASHDNDYDSKPINLNIDLLANNQYELVIISTSKSSTSAIQIPPPRIKDKKKERLNGDGDLILYESGSGILSFDNLFVSEVFLNNEVVSVNDPILGGSLIVEDTTLLSQSSNQGWLLSDTTYQIAVDDTQVLTADVVDSFLFKGSTLSGLDSEFQGSLENISINNIINSPYLSLLEEQIDSPRFIALSSNILTETNDLTESGSSEICNDCFMDSYELPSVPEPSIKFSIISLGIIGLASTLRRKKKSSE